MPLNQVVLTADGQNNSTKLLSDIPNSQFSTTNYSLILSSSSSQSIPNTANTAITFNTILRNLNFIPDGQSFSGSQIIIPAAGLWLLSVQATFDENATGNRSLFFQVNADGNFYGNLTVSAITGQTQPQVTSAVLSLNSGDSVQAFTLQSSGGALSIGLSPVLATRISLCRLSL